MIKKANFANFNEIHKACFVSFVAISEIRVKVVKKENQLYF